MVYIYLPDKFETMAFLIGGMHDSCYYTAFIEREERKNPLLYDRVQLCGTI